MNDFLAANPHDNPIPRQQRLHIMVGFDGSHTWAIGNNVPTPVAECVASMIFEDGKVLVRTYGPDGNPISDTQIPPPPEDT